MVLDNGGKNTLAWLYKDRFSGVACKYIIHKIRNAGLAGPTSIQDTKKIMLIYSGTDAMIAISCEVFLREFNVYTTGFVDTWTLCQNKLENWRP